MLLKNIEIFIDSSKVRANLKNKKISSVLVINKIYQNININNHELIVLKNISFFIYKYIDLVINKAKIILEFQ